MYIHHFLSYAVRNFHLNWLTFLKAMTDVLGVHFLSGHCVGLQHELTKICIKWRCVVSVQDEQNEMLYSQFWLQYVSSDLLQNERVYNE